MSISSYWHGDRQMTVFGLLPETAAYIAFLVVTIVTATMLIGALGAAARIDRVTSFVEYRLRAMGLSSMSTVERSQEEPLCWTGVAGNRPAFVITPALAHEAFGASIVANLQANASVFTRELVGVLTNPSFTVDGLTTLYGLLAKEITAYQLTVLGVVVSASASSAIIYVFPVSQPMGLLVINLIALLGVGVLWAYKTVDFEGNLVLSNILSNRARKPKWSIGLFAAMVIPFVVLGIVITIVKIPGVLEVGGGVLDMLAKLVKPGFLK